MREDPSLANAASVSDLIRFPSLNAQDKERSLAGAAGGVLVGRAHRTPYFLDFDNAINPHVFVCGVTGSGKTYLMKNLMLKLAKISGCTIALVDFTGEYSAFVEMAGGIQMDAQGFAEQLTDKEDNGCRILHLNLKNRVSQKARTEVADRVLNQIIEGMRVGGGHAGRVFVMLDEAWKLLEESRALHTLLREGRKYGYGLIFSSQLVEDVDLAMLSNVATLFIFRMQNKNGLSKLAGNYALRAGQVEAIQRLGVGGCAAIQSLVSGKREFCVIERVHGIEMEEIVLLKSGDEMQVEITKGKFEEVMGEACGSEAVSAAIHAGEQNGYVDLASMIAAMLNGGANARKLLEALRRLGIGESALADSFAVALSSQVKR